MNAPQLTSLLRELEKLREPDGGYDNVVDRFSNIAVLDHERKTQYRRVVIALQMTNPETTSKLLRDIQRDFASYGRLIVRLAEESRNVDGHGKVLVNATPISVEDQALYDQRCSRLRARVLDALISSGHAGSGPEWLL